MTVETVNKTSVCFTFHQIGGDFYFSTAQSINELIHKSMFQNATGRMSSDTASVH